MRTQLGVLFGSIAALGVGCGQRNGVDGASTGAPSGSVSTTAGAASVSTTVTAGTSGASQSTSGGTTGRTTSSATTGSVATGSTGRSVTSGGASGSTGGGTTSGSSSGLLDGGFDPGAPGPFTVGSTLDLSGVFASQTVPFDLYYPIGFDGGPLNLSDGGIPAVLVSHGFLDSKDSFAGWGAHLASWGFAVAVPTWTNGMNSTDAQANAASANALLDWMDAQGVSDAGYADAGALLYGLVDGKRHGLVGHSYGGLMVYVAASENPTAQIVVGLDPVDDTNDTAGNAVATIAGMGVILPAQSALCDLFATDQAAIYTNFPGQKLYAQVANAIHCDCQDPSGSGCEGTCGPTDPIRQMHFQRYATASLLWAFACDARTLTWIDGAEITADLGLSSTKNAAIACVPAL